MGTRLREDDNFDRSACLITLAMGVRVPFMSRVTSLTSMPEKELNRWIKRIALLFVVLLVAFVAMYAIDRFRAPQPAMIDKTLTALEDAVRANPADTVSRGRLADLYYAKKRFTDAITQYTALIEAKSDVELASLGRGKSYMQLQQYDQAKQDLQVVVQIARTGEMANVDPNLEAAYYNLGLIETAKGNPAGAIDFYSAALKITRTDADALNALGEAFIANNQADKALEPLRKAIALVPAGWAAPYQTLAQAYTKLGKADLAAWANAMATFESGDHSGAEAQLLKLVEGDAKVEAMVGLGVIYEQKGDSASAASWYAKVLAVDPSNVIAQMGLKRTSLTVPTAAPSPAASN